MYREKEIKPNDLFSTLTQLDLDEGIRIQDDVGFLTFITRSANEYTVNICMGSGEKWEYVNTSREVFSIFRRYVKEPFRVWLY